VQAALLRLLGFSDSGFQGVNWAILLDHQANKRVHEEDTPRHACKRPNYTSSSTCKHSKLTNDLHTGLDAATAKQSAWSESRAYLAVITVGQQDHQAGLSEPLGLSTGQELVKHNLHHQR